MDAGKGHIRSKDLGETGLCVFTRPLQAGMCQDRSSAGLKGRPPARPGSGPAGPHCMPRRRPARATITYLSWLAMAAAVSWVLLTRTPQCDVPQSQVRHTVTRQTEKLLQSRASQNPGEFIRSTRQMPLKGVIMVTIFYLPHCQACLQSTRQAPALPEEADRAAGRRSGQRGDCGRPVLSRLETGRPRLE